MAHYSVIENWNKVFCSFFNWITCFTSWFIEVFIYSGYKTLSDICTKNIFSPSRTSLFFLLMLFGEAEGFNFNVVQFIFFLLPVVLSLSSWKKLCVLQVHNVLLFSRSLVVLTFTFKSKIHLNCICMYVCGVRQVFKFVFLYIS